MTKSMRPLNRSEIRRIEERAARRRYARNVGISFALVLLYVVISYLVRR